MPDYERVDLAQLAELESVRVDPADNSMRAQRVAIMGQNPLTGKLERYQINSDGSLPMGGSLITKPYDTVLGSYPNSITEVYTYKLSSSVQNTVTVVYTDSTKSLISSVVRT